MIGTGIKGIRQILADNATGWHVTLNDENMGYANTDLKSIVASMGTVMTATLIGFTGNGLIFSTEFASAKEWFDAHGY